uniref:Uncharacterized protein n=1 Tax=Sipha flava TaxID=143950 RepID=A0A2S2Q7Q0_9HEMI
MINKRPQNYPLNGKLCSVFDSPRKSKLFATNLASQFNCPIGTPATDSLITNSLQIFEFNRKTTNSTGLSRRSEKHHQAPTPKQGIGSWWHIEHGIPALIRQDHPSSDQNS